MGPPVDRDKVTPLLLRVFWRIGNHNRDDSFNPQRGVFPSNELHFYTWPDATLGELSELLRDVVPEARRRNARISFSLVYPDKTGRTKVRHAGMVLNNPHRGGRPDDREKTLVEAKHETGDFMDIAVLL